MTRELLPNEIKQIELALLDDIVAICEQYHLRYFLAYGTLLGAVRHKGFIPWDDDIDIYMLREDYDKLIVIMADKPKGNHRMLSMYNDHEYFYEFAKIVDKRTFIQTSNLMENHHEGVWVDIFPLDNTPKFRRLFKWILNIIVAFRILSVYQTFPKGKFPSFLFPMWMISKMIGPRFFLKLSDKMARCFKPSDEVGYMCSMGVSKFSFPKRWCSETTLLDFEGKKYVAFKEYDQYLRHQYGNYMELPSEDKRVSHPINAYWRDDICS